MKPAVIGTKQVCLMNPDLPGEGRRFDLKAVLLTLFLGSMLAATPLALEASGPNSEADAIRGHLWVQLCDTSGLDTDALDGLVREVSRLYRPPAPRIVWHVECLVPSYLPASPLRVILMHRLPDAVRIRHRVFRKSSPLAWYGRNRESFAVFVSRDAVVEALGTPNRLHELLPRALGRVVAHELGHHFFGHRHTREGLMKRGLCRYDLVSPVAEDLKLTREQLETMRAYVERPFPAEGVVVRKAAEPPS